MLHDEFNAQLAAIAQELNCTEAEAAREVLSQYYEAAGFTDAPIASMSDAQAAAAVCSL